MTRSDTLNSTTLPGMVNPVPGYSVSTPYHKANSGMWNTCGWHTGQDYAAPAGTQVVAARAGEVVHVDYGSSLGYHQFVIRPGDGTEDFYAHCSTRVVNGLVVAAGTPVALVGSEGNATGPHLHFERHKGYGWSCSLMTDPMQSHNAADGDEGSSTTGDEYPTPSSRTVYLSKLRAGQMDSDSVWYLQDVLNRHSIPGGTTLPTTGNYLEMTDNEVRLDQRHHIPPEDPIMQSYVGSSQADHLFRDSGLTVVHDV